MKALAQKESRPAQSIDSVRAKSHREMRDWSVQENLPAGFDTMPRNLRKEQPHHPMQDAGNAQLSGRPLAQWDIGGISIFPRLQPAMQTKLTVNQPGDAYEQEANRVADQVMRLSGPLPGPAETQSASAGQQRTYQERMQRKVIETSNVAPEAAPPSVDEVLRSPGQPLDAATRAFFEPRFGMDFSNVRVHADETAAKSAQEVSAKAYTLKDQIVFGGGQFDPSQDEGRRLIAHELTHVVQQLGADEIHLGQGSEKHRAHSGFFASSVGPCASGPSAISYGFLRAHSQVQVGQSIARQPAPTPKASRKDTHATAQARLRAVVSRASGRAHGLNDAVVSTGQLLKDASSHLVKLAGNYKEAKEAFDKTLEEAKEAFERSNRIKELIEFLLVGTVLELIGPEVLLFEVLKPEMEAYKGWLVRPPKSLIHGGKVSVTARIFEVFASKVRDVGAEKFIDAIYEQGAQTSPPSQSDLVWFALNKLDELVQAQPIQILNLTQEQNDLALKVDELAGKPFGAVSQPTVDEVELVDSVSATFCDLALAAIRRFESFGEAVLRIDAKSSHIIEEELWTAWIATLDAEQGDVLATKVMAEKLHEMGYDRGRWTPYGERGAPLTNSPRSESEQRTVVFEAQNRWLEAHGVDRRSNDLATSSRFRGEWQLALISEVALNQVGIVTRNPPGISPAAVDLADSRDPYYVAIGEHRLPIRRVYWLKPAEGDRVRIVDLHIKEIFTHGTSAWWDESMFVADVETVPEHGEAVVSTRQEPRPY